MENCWKRRAFGLVVMVIGVVLLGAVPSVCAGPLPGDGVDGPELSYEDNGDGTTTDLNTRLKWEQKLPADNPACDPVLNPNPENRHVRCVNRCTYTWHQAIDFPQTLNNTCDGDGVSQCTGDRACRVPVVIGSGLCGYAGYRNWRLPNIRELHSIVDYGTRSPATDALLGATTSFPFYWSSTPQVETPSSAWIVHFDYGTVTVKDINDQYCVRAVRGGPQP
ncbi:MAG TPA: DUF1566 domain-containing protein [Candidatus Tectomicrobia bacterium]